MTKIVRRKRKRYFNYKTAVFILILIGLLFSLIFFMRTDYFNIDSVFVTGNALVNEDEVIARSGINKNSNIFSFNTSKAEEEIEKMTFVKEANIVRRYPNRVEIVIEERMAYFIYQQGNNFYEVDFDGVVLSKVDGIERYDIAIVSGMEIEKIKEGINIFDTDNVALNVIKEVVLSLKENDLFNSVSEIYYSKNKLYYIYLKNGSVIKFHNKSGFKNNLDFVKYFINEENNKVMVELIDGVNPIYSEI